MRTIRILTLLAASTLLAAGCGHQTPSQAGSSSAAGGCDVAVSGGQGSKPQVTVPANCPAPTTLQTKDLITGTGAPVKAGDTVEVNYTLYGWNGRTLVQSSYDSGQTFPVQNVGQAQVIEGWNKGLVGIRAGGRRLLLVPAAEGYGAQGTPDGTIKPNEALVFVVDAVSVHPAVVGPTAGGTG